MKTREERKAERAARKEELKNIYSGLKAEAETAKDIRRQKKLKTALNNCVLVAQEEAELIAKWQKNAEELEADVAEIEELIEEA